jgi:hypothetical protein
MKKQIIIALISIGLFTTSETVAMRGSTKKRKRSSHQSGEVPTVPPSARSTDHQWRADFSDFEDTASIENAHQQPHEPMPTELTEMQLRALGQWVLSNKQFIQTVF